MTAWFSVNLSPCILATKPLLWTFLYFCSSLAFQWQAYHIKLLEHLVVWLTFCFPVGTRQLINLQAVLLLAVHSQNWGVRNQEPKLSWSQGSAGSPILLIFQPGKFASFQLCWEAAGGERNQQHNWFSFASHYPKLPVWASAKVVGFCWEEKKVFFLRTWNWQLILRKYWGDLILPSALHTDGLGVGRSAVHFPQ